MYHINGYVYGNMPDLEGICEGEEIALYVFSLANGIHDMQIYGQTMIHRKHRLVTYLQVRGVLNKHFCFLLHCENVCCGYSLEAHLISPHNIFYCVRKY